MKLKTHEDEDGRKYIDINVKVSIGPSTMAHFLKLTHLQAHPFKDPDKWKIRDLLWQFRHEIMYNGRTRIDKIEINTDEEELYFGCAERYFPELKRY